MKTFLAICAGVIVTTLLVIGGDWTLAYLTDTSMEFGGSPFVDLANLIWIGFSVGVGSLVALTFNYTAETFAGFIVAQLFFGFGMLGEFWHQATWFNLFALLLVIPSVLLGKRFAGGGHTSFMRLRV